MSKNTSNWLERPIHPALPAITNEIVIFAAVILLALFTRFYDLGARVMSHDEGLHTYFSWLLYRGQGYQHSPMMHGPFQFHIVALSYFLFGASDFSARIPAVLFSIATVWMVWYWRRYLGRSGALIAGVLLVISPYMLYYGRYVRNESFVAFSGVLLLYAMLRHLEVGGKKYLYMLALAQVLHFASKETAFIYTAQALLFMAIYFIARITRKPWDGKENYYRAFIITLAIAIMLAGFTAGYGIYARDAATISGTETVAPSNPDLTASPLAPPETAPISLTSILALGALLMLGVAGFTLIRGYTWEGIRAERSFDLLMLLGVLILPMLAPFPIKFLEGWLHVTIPTDAGQIQALAGDVRSIGIIGGILAVMFILSAIAGYIWNKEFWWKPTLLFWAIFTILYTTVFTNSDGFFTGAIGSLGYWLVQQGVERGSQPWYFYLLVQIPMYEFLPALGVWLALYLGLTRKETPTFLFVIIGLVIGYVAQPLVKLVKGIRNVVEISKYVSGKSESAEDAIAAELVSVTEPETQVEEPTSEEINYPNTFSLLVWWTISSLLAFSYAGEKMPWLTVHMTLPMILLTGWAIGHVIDTTDWESLRERRPFIVLGLMTIFITSLTSCLLSLTGVNPPFQGKELAQLQATSAFLLPAIVTIASMGGLIRLLGNWTLNQFSRVFVLTFFGLLAVITARAAFRASYITYDQATEYLVYAHGARGIKDVIEQAREISERTTGGMGVALAYDASAPDTGVSWPFVWYLRDFTNQRSFDQPTRSLRDSVVVIVDQKNFDKIEPALGPNYNRMDYIRMWWPNQDYFGLVNPRDASQPFDEDYPCKGALAFFKLIKSSDYSRVCNALANPQMRAGIYQIWLNRDYTLYAQANNKTDMTLATWQPADQMRLYIRKDVAALMWNYGIAPAPLAETVDPTEGKSILLAADLVLDSTQQINPVQLNAPRSMAFAKDGTFYVADSRNHRVLHLDPTGKTLQQWGFFADGVTTPAPLGGFNEPWGVAVGPDGSVYVTDTWNHRVQKFTGDGKPLLTWGKNGLGDSPDSFYGPRGVAVDAKGRVYVADTGNKRIVVFDAGGKYISSFGSGGFDPGQFDEPVGVAVDPDGIVYVVDTWNQRLQSFQILDDGVTFTPLRQWDVYGWFGQSLENKPFIAVNAQKHVFVTDPEGYRVMEFTDQGELVRVWGDFGSTNAGFGLASGIAIDPENHVWVTDGLYNRILRFTLP
jgi:predicted membrane-bound mannosyltransferase/DNA-binding beta-propeller fold protein YncE